MSSSTDRVRDALTALGVEAQIQEFPAGTATAEAAAAALHTSVGQIVKSLIFLTDGKPVLALASGAHRVDLLKLAAACGAEAARRADAEEVRRLTGFAIGGVPPVGYEHPMPVVIDRELLQYEVVFAAAGSPHAVFAIHPARLREITQAVAADIRQE